VSVSDAVANIRNFGIVAHINAGKTTLSERILFDSGRLRFMGEVDEGTAALDYLPQEQRRGISIVAACTSVRWRGADLNLIDTPGHVDFGAEVARALAVLDGTVLVLDGVRGVEPQTEAVWRQTQALGLPSLVFVNKLDRAVADWAAVLESMRVRLRARVVPVVIPIRREQVLAGLRDVVSGECVEWEPGGEPACDPQQARTLLLEAAADFDDAVLADFVADRPIDPARVHAALRAGVVAGKLTLAYAGSALRNQGVDHLLDGVVAYLPSPVDRSPVAGIDGGHRFASADDPFSALVFRTLHEDGEHWLAVRVYSGVINAGTEVARSDGGAPFTVTAVARAHADARQAIAAAGPGDIVLIAGCAGDVSTGVTLFDPGHPFALAPARLPPPVLSVTIEPRHAADQADVERAAWQVVRNDPTLALRHDEARGALLLSGVGELQLEVAAEHMRALAGDRFRLGAPEVACRETVRAAARGQGEWRVAELRTRAEVQLAVAPVAGGGPARVRAAETCRDLQLAERLAGVLGSQLRSSLREGWPAFDLEVRLEDVYGETAASGVDPLPAVVAAAQVAMRRALATADPAVLQPVVAIEVRCPHDALSPVLGDLRGKHVDIAAIDVDGEQARVRGKVPLAAMLGYATRLRSLTRGLGSFHAEAAGFTARA
jgi:elongation factor G